MSALFLDNNKRILNTNNIESIDVVDNNSKNLTNDDYYYIGTFYEDGTWFVCQSIEIACANTMPYLPSIYVKDEFNYKNDPWDIGNSMCFDDYARIKIDNYIDENELKTIVKDMISEWYYFEYNSSEFYKKDVIINKNKEVFVRANSVNMISYCIRMNSGNYYNYRRYEDCLKIRNKIKDMEGVFE